MTTSEREEPRAMLRRRTLNETTSRRRGIQSTGREREGGREGEEYRVRLEEKKRRRRGREGGREKISEIGGDKKKRKEEEEGEGGREGED